MWERLKSQSFHNANNLLGNGTMSSNGGVTILFGYVVEHYVGNVVVVCYGLLRCLNGVAEFAVYYHHCLALRIELLEFFERKCHGRAECAEAVGGELIVHI